MQKIKSILKWVGGILLVIILGLVIAGWLAHEDQPAGDNDPQRAKQLVQKMETAVNKAAWDTTRWVAWRFRTNTSYVWDKQRNMVLVKWKDYEVQLHTPSQTGLVFQAGNPVMESEQKDELVATAWSFFANDSFWLCAPMKASDPGVKQDVVVLENGEEGLLVTYSSGGVTPGDTYLWLLDENGRPNAWQMWVGILPIGGLEFSWNDWVQNKHGAWLATQHAGAIADVPIFDLLFEEDIPAILSGADPLAALAEYRTSQ